MRNKFLILLLFSTSCLAQFSQKESNELNEINTSIEIKLQNTSKELDKSIDNAIHNSPDDKDLILNLKNSWSKMIVDKCKFETIDSKGTDAEISEIDTCYIKEYNEEIKYFNSILP